MSSKRRTLTRKLVALSMAAAVIGGTAAVAATNNPLVSPVLTVSAAAVTGDILSEGDYNYSINDDGTATITKYVGESVYAAVPETVNGAKVTAIGVKAFYQSKINTVSIPKTVRYIGEAAFLGCKDLTSVDIFDGVSGSPVSAKDCDLVYIGKKAFKDCVSLKNAIIPDSVVYIDNFAFKDDKALANIILGNSVSTIGYQAFYMWSNPSQSVKFSLGESVRYIEEDAFKSSRDVPMGLIFVPNTVEYIGAHAFAGIGGSGEWERVLAEIADFYGAFDKISDAVANGLASAYLVSVSSNEAVQRYCQDPTMESFGMGLNHTEQVDDDGIEETLAERVGVEGIKDITRVIPTVSNTSAYTGDTVQFTGKAVVPDDEEEYTYQYTFTVTDMDNKNVFSKTQSSSAVDYKVTTAGVYNVAVKADTLDKNKKVKATSTVYRKLVVSEPITNEITIEANHLRQTSNVNESNNAPFVLHCAANNGVFADSYEYKFDIYRVTDDSKLVVNSKGRGYKGKGYTDTKGSTSDNMTATDTRYATAMSVPGTYKVVTYVKDAAERPVKKEFTVVVDGILGKTISLKGNEIVDSYNLSLDDKKTYQIEYEFAVKKLSSNKWTVKQNGSTGSYNYTPENSGTYQFRITQKLKNKTTDEIEETKSSTFTAKVVSTLAFDTAQIGNNNSKVTINSGNSVDVTVKAKDGTGGYKYAVYYKQASQTTWSTVQGFTAVENDKDTVKIPVTPKSSGAYKVCVKVQDSEGSEQKKYFDLTVNPLQNTSALSKTSIVFGETVTVTAKAGQGSGDYTYAVLYKKKTDTKWTTVQNFSSNNKVSIKPKSAAVYDVCVKVKDTKSGLIEKKFFDLDVVNNFTNVSSIAATSVPIGKEVKVTVKATNGKAVKYTYAVLYKKKTDTKWVTKVNFDDNKTVPSGNSTAVSIKPQKVADYDVCVKVKNVDSGCIVKKFLNFTVTEPEKALTNTSSVSKTKIALGNTVTVTGKASNGAGTYTYAVYYKLKDQTKWTTAQNFSTNKTVTLTPTTAGVYDVCVKVKDFAGTIEKKYLTVTVTE